MGIKNIEDKLLEKVADVLKVNGEPLIKEVGVLPSDWDNDMLRRFAAVAPCVLIAFSGGVVKNDGTNDAVTVNSQWSVIAITGHASGNAARRRGDSTRIGAFEICERLVPELHGFTIGDEGTMSLAALENLWSGEIEKQGIAVYALRFELPMTFPFIADESSLDAFETFVANYDIPPHAGELEYASWLQDDFTESKPEARDEVSLPQS